MPLISKRHHIFQTVVVVLVLVTGWKEKYFYLDILLLLSGLMIMLPSIIIYVPHHCVNMVVASQKQCYDATKKFWLATILHNGKIDGWCYYITPGPGSEQQQQQQQCLGKFLVTVTTTTTTTTFNNTFWKTLLHAFQKLMEWVVVVVVVVVMKG